MKRIGLLCATSFVLAAGPAPAAVVERIVAVVNGEIILESQLEERGKVMFAEAKKDPDPVARKRREASLRREVLDHLVDEELLSQQARELKIVVTPQDVDRMVDDVKKRNNLDDTTLVDALAQQGMDLVSYREVVKKQITRLRVLDVTVRARVSVTDEDVRRYYESNLKQLGADRKVRASHIFLGIPPEATAAEADQIRRRALELVQRARGGEDFAKLARENSQDTATRSEGGDLGYFGRGMLPPAVEEIVFSMAPGEVRGPVRAERGFHVIKLVDRKDEKARPFEDVKEQIREQLMQQEMEKHTRTWLAEMRRKAHVAIRL